MDLRTRINNGDFNPGTQNPYPLKPVKPAKISARVSDLSPAELREMADLKAAYDAEVESYRARVNEYRAEEARLLEAFRVAALDETGLTGHKNADRIWAKAWEDGHSSGLTEVLLHLEELAELVL